MLACVDAGDVKKAETPTSPIATAPETAANIFVKRVMCASLSTGARRCECTRSQTAGQRCALVHAAWFSAFTLRLERPLQPLETVHILPGEADPRRDRLLGRSEGRRSIDQRGCFVSDAVHILTIGDFGSTKTQGQIVQNDPFPGAGPEPSRAYS